jgi:hypothetical protein
MLMLRKLHLHSFKSAPYSSHGNASGVITKRIEQQASAKVRLMRFAPETGWNGDLLERFGCCLVMSDWVKKIGPALLFGLFVVFLNQSASSQEGDCALFTGDAQLCLFDDGRAKECLRLDPNRFENIDQSRCLVRSFSSIERCRGVTIAQNVFVLLRPLAIRFEAVLFRNPSKEFYSEQRIRGSCRTR